MRRNDTIISNLQIQSVLPEVLFRFAQEIQDISNSSSRSRNTNTRTDREKRTEEILARWKNSFRYVGGGRGELDTLSTGERALSPFGPESGARAHTHTHTEGQAVRRRGGCLESTVVWMEKVNKMITAR